MINYVWEALKIADKAHKNQVDKGGAPYIHHVIEVAKNFEYEYDIACALLHDVIEDSDYTIEDIINAGLPNSMAKTLDLLTRKKDESYIDYIKRIKTDELATQIKIADILHNMDITRIPNATIGDYTRQEKYRKALDYLKDEECYLITFVGKDLRNMLSTAVSTDYLDNLIDKILPDVVDDIKMTSEWEETWDYSKYDIQLAVGRVLLQRFGEYV